jgi:hypothetical protein
MKDIAQRNAQTDEPPVPLADRRYNPLHMLTLRQRRGNLLRVI